MWSSCPRRSLISSALSWPTIATRFRTVSHWRILALSKRWVRNKKKSKTYFFFDNFSLKPLLSPPDQPGVSEHHVFEHRDWGLESRLLLRAHESEERHPGGGGLLRSGTLRVPEEDGAKFGGIITIMQLRYIFALVLLNVLVFLLLIFFILVSWRS